MFYKVEYKVNLRGENHESLGVSSCYMMIEAKDEDALNDIIERDIKEANNLLSNIEDIEVSLVTTEEYMAEQKKQLESIIINEYLRYLQKTKNISLVEYKEMIKDPEVKAKAYHFYLHNLVSEQFVKARVNLDDISASTYIDFISRLGGATTNETQQEVIKEILSV